ncbi:MFS transporter [Iodobacter arcticus]|uniref:MFS transporter n=1 Tax=Iodobacter arcticus TaxID=590593 RepID=A0ABW2QSD9_9NEIS
MLNTSTPAQSIDPASLDNALYRKVSMRIIPFLFICYVISFLDRINIGFAQLQMKQNLGFSDAMYGLGIAIFYIAYVLFEVPSNLLLERFGARKTFTRIMLLWGMVSVGMAWVSTPSHFYAMRFLLGIFEAGFFPGIVLYLTYWYPAKRRAAVMSIFFAGVAVAGILGGLISGWIMRDMAGVLGMYGWQWMFIIEGSPALILAFVAYFYIDDRPAQATWLDAREQQQLTNNLVNDPHRAQSGLTHSFSSALSNPLVYQLAFVYFSLSCASLTLNFWMPIMIRDFGISNVLSISLYSAIPNAFAAVGVILIARHSDKHAERRKHFSVCVIGGALFLSLLTLHPTSLVLTLALLSAAAVLIFSGLPIFWAVPATYLSGTAAAGGIALISSIGMLSGIVSPWLVGQIKTRTGSMDNALYLLSVLLVMSAITMLFFVKNNKYKKLN